MKTVALGIIAGVLVAVAAINTQAADAAMNGGGAKATTQDGCATADTATSNVQDHAMSTKSKSSQSGAEANAWRYCWHNGRWWYWMPDNKWVVWTGATWIPYERFVAQTGGYSGAYSASYGSYDQASPAVSPAPSPVYYGGNYSYSSGRAVSVGSNYAGYGWSWGPGTAFSNGPGGRF